MEIQPQPQVLNNLTPLNIEKQPQLKKPKQPRYKSYWQIMLIIINLSLSNFYFGYVLVYISTVDFNDVINTFGVTLPTQTARGILTGCIPIGALFGALIGKKLIHVFSRRNFILFINACGFVSGTLLYITHVESFIIMRVIQGACIGMYTAVIPLIMAQISPIEMSGSTGAFTQIFASVGTTTAYLFYYILSVTFSKQNQSSIWYYVFGLPLVTLSIQTIILLFVFPYETPKYYLLHHQKSKAKQLIAQLYKPQYVDVILQQKIEDLQEAHKKQQMQQQRKSMQRLPSKVSVGSALSGVQIQQPKTSPIPIFTAIHINILRQFVGINAVLAYGGSIVKSAIPSLKSIAPIFLTFQNLLGALVSIYLLTKFGRKTILQFGTFILAFSMLLITIGFFILQSNDSAGKALILPGLIIFMFTFGATLGSILWQYTAQICEPSYIIIAIVFTWIGATVVIVLFPILKTNLPNQNPAYLFLFFFLWTSISFVLNQKVLIQTKGKTQHQIHQEYNNMKLCGYQKLQDSEEAKKEQYMQQAKSNQKIVKIEQSSAQIILKAQLNKNQPNHSHSQNNPAQNK